MKKLKLYLETSIFNFAISDQVPDYKEATLRFLDSIRQGAYEACLSEVVLREISEADKEKAAQLMSVVNSLELERLELNRDIETLSEEYIKADLIPVKYADDALHIAVASFYALDAILTWNFEHMVKFKTRKGVIAVNALLGYKPIDIITPLEVG